MKKSLIALAVLVVIVGGYFGYMHWKKSDLVDKIETKNKGNKMYDADRSKLMKFDIKTLEGLLNGTIK